MHNIQKSSNRGFTLIELSIVVVIIGLIVAAIVAGGDLVIQSKLKSISSEFDKYKSSYNTFLLKYTQPPGDIDNAHNYFGSDCDTTASECNGDGNRVILYSGTAEDNEALRAWQHLNLAELIEERALTGRGYGTGLQADIGTNVPASFLRGAGFYFDSSASYFNSTTHLMLGTFKTNSKLSNSALTPTEARSIDKKIDDGIPLAGNMYSINGDDASGNCTTGSGTSSTYNVGNGNIDCRLFIKMDF